MTPTTKPIRIDPKIADHVDAAIKAGFTVYASRNETRATGHVYVCKELDGPFALIQVPTHTWDPVELDVPIIPHKDYGSGVKVDHDGTPEDAVRVLEKACSEETVTVRFMTKQYIARHGVPKVPNAGSKVITKYGRTMDSVTRLGERGTNWTVQQQAGRLEVGDRFTVKGHPDEVMTVQHRRYSGDNVVLWYEELEDHTIELAQREFVTLVGAA